MISGMPSETVEYLLAPVIRHFQSQEAFIYAEHPNLWVELGWDVCEGDGEVAALAEQILANRISECPPAVLYGAWWQSPAGKMLAREIRDAIENDEFESVDVEFTELHDVSEGVLEHVLEMLLVRAETAYLEVLDSDDLDSIEEDQDDYSDDPTESSPVSISDQRTWEFQNRRPMVRTALMDSLARTASEHDKPREEREKPR